MEKTAQVLNRHQGFSVYEIRSLKFMHFDAFGDSKRRSIFLNGTPVPQHAEWNLNKIEKTFDETFTG